MEYITESWKNHPEGLLGWLRDLVRVPDQEIESRIQQFSFQGRVRESLVRSHPRRKGVLLQEISKRIHLDLEIEMNAKKRANNRREFGLSNGDFSHSVILLYSKVGL
jgi:hypothetical protein